MRTRRTPADAIARRAALLRRERASQRTRIASSPRRTRVNARRSRTRPALAEIARALAAESEGGIPASTIGVDPEGAIADDHARSRLAERASSSTPPSSTRTAPSGASSPCSRSSASVLLLTDPTSKIPAIVQRGRWWGIATATNEHIQLQYVSQDAPLRVGDAVVTGEGRTFHAGVTIGRIVTIYRPQGALYQTRRPRTRGALRANRERPCPSALSRCLAPRSKSSRRRRGRSRSRSLAALIAAGVVRSAAFDPRRVPEPRPRRS